MEQRFIDAVSAALLGFGDEDDAWAAVLRVFRDAVPHDGVASLSALSPKSEAFQLSTWYRHVVTNEPPPAAVTLLYFGLFETEDGPQLYLSGSDRLWTQDPDYLVRPIYWPEGRYADWPALVAVSRVVSALKADGGAGSWALPLSLGVLTVRAMIRGNPAGLPVVVGFDDGDRVLLSLGPENGAWV